MYPSIAAGKSFPAVPFTNSYVTLYFVSGSGAFGVNVHVPTNFTSAPSIVFEFTSHEANVHVPLFVVSSYDVCVGCLAVTVAPSAYSVSSVGL